MAEKFANIIIYRIMKFILKFIRGHTWSATEIQKNIMYKIELSLNTIRKTRYQPYKRDISHIIISDRNNKTVLYEKS